MRFDQQLFNSFDLVIVDPPFLSEECLTKSLQTAKSLTRKHVILCTGQLSLKSKLHLINLLLQHLTASTYLWFEINWFPFQFSGAIMEELAKKLLDVHKCSFEPKHKNNLANQFACFTNFSSELD